LRGPNPLLRDVRVLRGVRTHVSVKGEDYAELFRVHGARVWRAVYAYTGCRKEIAEDAVAEAFVRAIEHSETISSPLPWILRTAVRIAREELRREKRHGELESANLMSAEGLAPEDLQDLIRALRLLSANQRLAVVLHYVEDLPVSEIARMMDTATPTVRVHLLRGRRRLRRLLPPTGGSRDV
jgi:RNA polymerase sigma-70 factor, ECF subfamily